MKCQGVRTIIEAHLDVLEDSFKENNKRIFEFDKAKLNVETIPNDEVRLVIFHDYPGIMRRKCEDELRRFTNVLILINVK